MYVTHGSTHKLIVPTGSATTRGDQARQQKSHHQQHHFKPRCSPNINRVHPETLQGHTYIHTYTPRAGREAQNVAAAAAATTGKRSVCLTESLPLVCWCDCEPLLVFTPPIENSRAIAPSSSSLSPALPLPLALPAEEEPLSSKSKSWAPVEPGVVSSSAGCSRGCWWGGTGARRWVLQQARDRERLIVILSWEFCGLMLRNQQQQSGAGRQHHRHQRSSRRGMTT